MIHYTIKKVKIKYIIAFGTLILALILSCKKEKNNANTKNDGNIERRIDSELLLENNVAVDILRYKVKQEIFENDSLQLIFKNIYLYPLSDNEYKLQIKVDCDNMALKYYTDYYIIMAIYPKDSEIHLLDHKRQKHKFESFSAKIRKGYNDKLIISRKIKTKLDLARAVTVSVMAYKTKQKSMEVVLMNVNFLN